MRLTSLFLFCSSLFSWGDASPPPLFFWDARPQHGFSNFGDALSEVLVERILQRKIETTNTPFANQRKFLGMGSILHYAQEGDTVWGTGLNGKKSDLAHCRFAKLDVRAVRGPITRQFLLERGTACPEIYGDPTLLVPRLFPEFERAAHPSQDYLIIPHFSDEPLFVDNPQCVVSVKENWEVVIRKILDSRFVISSSLSGIIVAEAFGIPARLLRVQNQSNTEDLVKYADYYQGTNRPHFQYATTVEEALEMGGESLPTCDLEKLYDSFPFDLF